MRCVTGFSRVAFDMLLKRFEIRYDIRPRGLRDSTISARDALGIVLHWLNSTMRYKTLSLIFAIPSGSISRVLMRSLGSLMVTLSHLYEARIEWPSLARIEKLSQLVANRVSNLGFSCFGFVDGVKFPVQVPNDARKQRCMYNGWYHAHYVGNVIVTGSDGLILWSKFNCPGSWNDASIARSLFKRLEVIPLPYAIVADTAFPRTRSMSGHIHTPIKRSDIARGDPIEFAQQIDHHNKVLSIRQAAEWSMRAIQGSFARLKLPLHWDDQVRASIIYCVLHLHNYRVRMDGINQVATVFDPDWVPGFLSDNTNDRIARYYRLVDEDD